MRESKSDRGKRSTRQHPAGALKTALPGRRLFIGLSVARRYVVGRRSLPVLLLLSVSMLALRVHTAERRRSCMYPPPPVASGRRSDACPALAGMAVCDPAITNLSASREEHHEEVWLPPAAVLNE